MFCGNLLERSNLVIRYSLVTKSRVSVMSGQIDGVTVYGHAVESHEIFLKQHELSNNPTQNQPCCKTLHLPDSIRMCVFLNHVLVS